MKPFSREDAHKRIQIEKNVADTWRACITERESYRDSATNVADRDAAEACAEIARRKVAFAEDCASWYERIGKGEKIDG